MRSPGRGAPLGAGKGRGADCGVPRGGRINWNGFGRTPGWAHYKIAAALLDPLARRTLSPISREKMKTQSWSTGPRHGAGRAFSIAPPLRPSLGPSKRRAPSRLAIGSEGRRALVMRSPGRAPKTISVDPPAPQSPTVSSPSPCRPHRCAPSGWAHYKSTAPETKHSWFRLFLRLLLPGLSVETVGLPANSRTRSAESSW